MVIGSCSDRALGFYVQEKESHLTPEPMRLMERSVFSDRMVFVKAVHEARWMNDMELSVYDAW